MGKIILIAESGCDISPDEKERYSIRTVPMHVIFDGETREDGTFPPLEVIDYYRKNKKIPTTSGAMTYDFGRAFDEISAAEPTASVLHIGYSSVTTCSYGCARQAADARPQMPFAQVDTGMFSYGQYSVLIRMAESIKKHPEWSLEDAKRAAQEMIDHSCMAFVPDGFAFLRAGGRVRNASALVGEMLKIHPRVDQVNGYLVAGKKYRGSMSRVIPEMIRDFVGEYQTERPEIWFGHTPEFSDENRTVAENTVRELGFTKIHWIACGSIITTQGGPGCFGLSGFGKNH